MDPLEDPEGEPKGEALEDPDKGTLKWHDGVTRDYIQSELLTRTGSTCWII